MAYVKVCIFIAVTLPTPKLTDSYSYHILNYWVFLCSLPHNEEHGKVVWSLKGMAESLKYEKSIELICILDFWQPLVIFTFILPCSSCPKYFPLQGFISWLLFTSLLSYYSALILCWETSNDLYSVSLSSIISNLLCPKTLALLVWSHLEVFNGYCWHCTQEFHLAVSEDHIKY